MSISITSSNKTFSNGKATVQKQQYRSSAAEFLLYGLIALCIGVAIYNNSWASVIIIGTSVLIIFLLVKTFAPQFISYGVSLCLGILSALVAFQLKENPHAILAFFISALCLLFYNQWKSFIPIMLVFIGHQIAFYYNITRKAEVPPDMTLQHVYTLLFTFQILICTILIYRIRHFLTTKLSLEERYTSQHAHLTQNIAYAKQIAAGNFDTIAEISSDDVLGLSLMEMSKNLKASAEENKNRNWAMTGIAKIAEIMRLSNHKMEDLSNQIISYLVKYLNATQGGLFVIDDSDPDHKYLELKGCYAYERKKFLEKRIKFGEGLVGQSIMERNSMYFKVVPQDYFNITSGLGQANPKTLIIVPLKTENNVVGALEIGSFHDFPEYQREFLERVSETIASSIVFAKSQDQTTKLLKDSQAFAEQLRAQEEEMRQNMEELQATQEDVQRKNTDMEAAQMELTKERYLMEALMKNAKEFIYFKDLQSRFIRISNNMAGAFKVKDPKEIIGKSDFDFFTEEHARPAYEGEQEIIRTGKPIIDLLEKETWEDGRETYVLTSKMPLQNLQGKTVGTFGISRDITKAKKDEIDIQKKEKFYDVILKNSSEIYTMIDGDGKIMFQSPSYFKLLGLKETKLHGTALVSLVNKEDEETLLKAIDEVKTDANKTVQATFHFRKENGQWVTMGATLLNYIDEENIKGIILISREQ